MHGHNIIPVGQASAITYTATSATVLFWGLHISDIAVMISAFASICGVGLQFYVVVHRIRRLERGHDKNEDNIAATRKVTAAISGAVRALDDRVQETEKDN